MALDDEARRLRVEFDPPGEEARQRASFRPREGSVLPGEGGYSQTCQEVLIAGGPGLERLAGLLGEVLAELRSLSLAVSLFTEVEEG